MEATAILEFVPLRLELDPVARLKRLVWGGIWLLAMAFVDDGEEALICLVVATVMLGLMNLLPMREGMKKIVPVPPGSVVGPEPAMRLSPVRVVVATGLTVALVVLVVTDVLPSGMAGLAVGLEIGNGLPDAWERWTVRRFYRKQGRRLVRPKKSSGFLRRDYFVAV